jgi:hypothetical protein
MFQHFFIKILQLFYCIILMTYINSFEIVVCYVPSLCFPCAYFTIMLLLSVSNETDFPITIPSLLPPLITYQVAPIEFGLTISMAEIS